MAWLLGIWLGYHRDGEWAAQSEPLPTRNMQVQVFKQSITGVANSGATLPGTHGRTIYPNEPSCQLV